MEAVFPMPVLDADGYLVDPRFVIRHLMERLGPGSRNRLFELFP